MDEWRRKRLDDLYNQLGEGRITYEEYERKKKLLTGEEGGVTPTPASQQPTSYTSTSAEKRVIDLLNENKKEIEIITQLRSEGFSYNDIKNALEKQGVGASKIKSTTLKGLDVTKQQEGIYVAVIWITALMGFWFVPLIFMFNKNERIKKNAKIAFVLMILFGLVLTIPGLILTMIGLSDYDYAGSNYSTTSMDYYDTINFANKDEWYCETLDYDNVRVNFELVGSDYSRCLWTSIDNTERVIVASQDCAPTEWGCFSSSGTLQPAQCWEFTNCTINNVVYYRECGYSTSYVIDLPEGSHEVCAFPSVKASECSDCWSITFEEVI